LLFIVVGRSADAAPIFLRLNIFAVGLLVEKTENTLSLSPLPAVNLLVSEWGR